MGPSGQLPPSQRKTCPARRTLTECIVEKTDAIAFKVRSHRGGAKVNRDIRFVRCKVLDAAFAWLIRGDDYDTRTEGVTLDDCTAQGVLQIDNGADEVAVQGGSFGCINLLWPESAELSGTTSHRLCIWAEETSDGKTTFVPRINLANVTTDERPLVVGDAKGVEGLDSVKVRSDETGERFWGDNFWDEKRFREHASEVENARLYFHETKRRGWLWGDGDKDGFVVWPVVRSKPIGECRFSYYSYIPFKNERAFVFSVSVDEGKTWTVVNTRRPKSSAGAECWGGGVVDVTEQVRVRDRFLLKLDLQNGGGRLHRIVLMTR